MGCSEGRASPILSPAGFTYVAIVLLGCIMTGMVKLTRLKSIRQRKALTQQQLAEKAGVSRVTIARLEGGTDEPFPTTVRRVADALGVDPEDLMEPFVWARPGPRQHGVENGPLLEPNPRLTLGPPAADPRSDDRLAVISRQDVRRLLREEPELAVVVREATTKLVNFIPDARLSLQVLTDPDYGDSEQLFLGVSTNLQDGEALEALGRFDREWWAHHVGRTRGLLCIDLSEE